MKNFSIVLISCFAVFQLATAESQYAKECLVENGFKETDMNLVRSIGKVEFMDIVKDEQREKLSCVLACIFRKENPGQSLYEVIKDVLSEDTEKSENLRKEMSETLSTCKTQAGDDNCKLLQCIKITKLPFYEALSTQFAVARDMQKCFVDNGLKASDAVNMEYFYGPEDLENILKMFDEDKVACTMTCVYALKTKMNAEQTLQKSLEARINESDRVTADQKKEMLEALNKCGTEAAGDNCKLVKCIKILRAPFLKVYQY